MEQRLDYQKISPAAFEKQIQWHMAVKKGDVEPRLRELVLIRVSQINRCGYCLDMHTKDARALGETERRIYALNAWEESSMFTAKEKAALGWAEAVTLLGNAPVSDKAYEEVRTHFTEKETVDLTYLICSINALNRLGATFRSQPPKD